MNSLVLQVKYIEFRYDLLLFDDEDAPLNAARLSL